MTDDRKAKLAEWVDELRPFLAATIDQLRTFIVVHDMGSIRAAALQILKRDPSSVEKQLRALEDHFWTCARERLIVKTPGSSELGFTRSGERVYQFAQAVLRELTQARAHFEKAHRLRIALAKFTIPMLAEVEAPIWKRFNQFGTNPERELIHVRSDQVQEILRDPTVDFCFGALLTGQPIVEGLEFVRHSTQGLMLLTNMPLPVEQVDVEQLRSLRLPLILPTGGILREFVARALGGAEGLNVLVRCNDVQFAVDLLRARVHEACVICGEWVVAEVRRSRDWAELFRAYPIVGSTLRIELGLFRRRDDATAHGPDHPVQIFWDTFKEFAEKRGAP